MNAEKDIIKAEVSNTALIPSVFIALIIDAILFSYGFANDIMNPDYTYYGIYCPIIAIVLPIAFIGIKKFILNHVQLVLTDRRVYGKTGIINTKSVDSPISKINSVSIEQGFWGKVFHYSTVLISTSSGNYKFDFLKDAERFKEKTMEQIELYENDKLKKQAAALAESMSK